MIDLNKPVLSGSVYCAKFKIMNHYQETVFIPFSPSQVFDVIDNHEKLSSHMNKSSWMMGGGKMETEIDEGEGKKVGSHIKMKGKVFGIEIYLDEVVIKREPPYLKVWETVGNPRLLVIGPYQMKVEIKEKDNGSLLTVSIDYEMPKTNIWLGFLFGEFYAKWCVKQMLKSASQHN